MMLEEKGIYYTHDEGVAVGGEAFWVNKFAECKYRETVFRGGYSEQSRIKRVFVSNVEQGVKLIAHWDMAGGVNYRYDYIEHIDRLTIRGEYYAKLVAEKAA